MTALAYVFSSEKDIEDTEINNSYQTKTDSSRYLIDRFPPPKGYHREAGPGRSFSMFLRNLPLHPEGSLVKYYDGRKKPNQGVYSAVVDLEIGKKDLHQCADAIIRLRAQYFWDKGQFDQIRFHLTNGFLVEYSKWMEGNRVQVKGNETKWKKMKEPSNRYDDFWEYLEFVFMYAGTASLEKELKSVPIDSLQIGDVFIRGGFPGHAVIVVDMAKSDQSEKKLFMLAQSYMPAQELQILQNPTNKALSPWYELQNGRVVTPEYTFEENELRRFEK